VIPIYSVEQDYLPHTCYKDDPKEAGVRQNKRLALVIMFKMMSLLVVQVLCDGLETTLNLI